MSHGERPQIFQSNPIGMIVVDERGIILAANTRASRFLNLPSDAFPADHQFAHFLEKSDAGEFYEWFTLLVHRFRREPQATQYASGTGPFRTNTQSFTSLHVPDETHQSTAEPAIESIEVRINTAEKNTIWLEVTPERLNPPGNESMTGDATTGRFQFLLTLTDVTRYRQLAVELKQQNEKLIQDVAKIARKRREDARQSVLNYQVACEQIELARSEKRIADQLAARWKSLTENAPQIVMLVDRSGSVLFCNRQSNRNEITAPSEIQDVSDYLASRDRALSRRMIEDAIHHQENRTYEIECESQQGKLVWYSVSVGPVIPKPGDPSDSVVLIATDITQRKLAERLISQHQEELAHVSRMASMGALTVELAHELNQPLGVIGFYIGGCILEMSHDDWDLERIEIAHQKILAETERASHITDTILDFIRRREAPRLTTEVNWLIKEALTLAELEASKHRIRVDYELANDLPEVKVNRVQIQQIVMNLITNAVHSVSAANRENPKVRIVTRAMHGGGIEVSVTDNGLGFDSEVQARIFQPLFTTKEKGTGMGLSICRTLIELHGGRISASSIPGEGATFSFTLPSGGNTEEIEQVKFVSELPQLIETITASPLETL